MIAETAAWPSGRAARRVRTLAAQVLLVAAFLALWQWLPQVPNIRGAVVWLDPFFISSPARCAVKLWQIVGGAGHTQLIWPALLRTVGTALVGSVAALVVGVAEGLLLSDSDAVNRVVRPFLTLFNALPKVAIIPVIVLIAGSSSVSDAVVAFVGVLFLALFSAYEGGRSVPTEMWQNARLLGAGRTEIIRRVRWPFALAWTFAQLPNVIAFGLVGTVTAELFTGSSGIGQTLILAVDSANADLTLSVVLLLALVGTALVLLGDLVKARRLHWL